MAYLFWAFAAVWIGLFVYLYGLLRRSRALEQQLADLAQYRRPGSSGPAPAPGQAAAPREGAPR